MSATVCALTRSTCEAQRDYRNVDCMTLDAVGDALCGTPGVPDGVCQELEPGMNRCTVLCLNDEDCRLGVTCDTSVPLGQCLFF
jgi:hypothetical protein